MRVNNGGVPVTLGYNWQEGPVRRCWGVEGLLGCAAINSPGGSLGGPLQRL